jgi:hypothetical protein
MLALQPRRGHEEASVTDDRGRAEDRRGVGLWLAVGTVVLIVALGVALLLLTRDDPPSTAPPTPPPVAPSSATVAPSTAAPSPTASALPTAPLTAAPSGVTWSLFQGVALPTSPEHGPRRVDGPVHAGYARTPEGALIASHQISARHLLTPGTGWRQVVTDQVIASPGRDRYMALRERVTTDSVPPGTYGQTVGFRFVTYSPDVAVIQTVTRFASGNMSVVTETVRWVDGDWKLELQPDGSTTPSRQSVTSAAGFVPWGGV